MKALNAQGQSIVHPETVIGYSGEDKPTAAPANFELSEEPNATAAAFTWSHVDPSTLRGHFIGYRVHVEALESLSGEEMDGVVQREWMLDVPPEQREAQMIGLHPMTRYRGWVTAMNMGHRGPPSAKLEFETGEGPPSSVRGLEVEAVGARTIVVSWEPPLAVPGRLEGYFLSLTEMSEEGATEETFLPALRQHYVWWAAEPDTTYSVAVWGATGGGEGPEEKRLTKTWPPVPPARPEVRVEALSASVARVEWLPSEEGLPGSAFFLNYSLATGPTGNEGQEWKITEAVRVPGRTKTLTGLVPNAAYLLKLIATDGPTSTSSQLLRFHTPTRGGLGRGEGNLAPDTLTSAAWFIAAIASILLAVLFCLVVSLLHRNRGGKHLHLFLGFWSKVNGFYG